MSTYVFGYGSLINMQQNTELTLPKKSCPVLVTGLKRSLNVSGPHSKFRVFGVKKTNTHACNGILFKVSAQELATLIEREKLYTMKTLDKAQIRFIYKKNIAFKPADHIICFYPQAKYVLPKKVLHDKPISQEYLKICNEGATKISEEFLLDFLDASVID